MDVNQVQINQIRPEWLEAVNQAWWNWRFLTALVVPIAAYTIAIRWRHGVFYIAPVAVGFVWFFMSAGVYNVSSVMADLAVTNKEMALAAADTGRTFAPLFWAPVWAFLYNAALAFTFTAVRKMRGSDNCQKTETGRGRYRGLSLPLLSFDQS